MGDVKASDIASFLASDLIGKDQVLASVSSIGNLKDNSLAFVNKNNIKLSNDKEVLYLVPLVKNIEEINKASYIKVQNPRLAFAKVVKKFFVKHFSSFISPSAKIAENVKIGKNVYIGHNTIISENVTIGDNTVIRENVIIHSNVIIGTNCFIRSGVVIGEDGFGFDFDEDGTPIHLPHVGGVKIGDYVEIGANSVIAKGTLDDTIIGNYVKIDALVHIAHNCQIGEKSTLIALSQISGSVKIGKNCWIAPSSTIIQKKVIGDNAKIGIGAVVINDVKDNQTVMGLDAINAIDVFRFKKKNAYGK